MTNDTTAGTQTGTTAGTAGASNDTEDALSRVMAELEDAAGRGLPTVAALFRRNRATGRDDLVRKFTPDEFDPFGVGEKFGGGQYFVRCRTGAKWGSSARFDVADPRGGGLAAISPAPIPAPAPAAAPGAMFTPEGMLALIMQQNQSQTAQMMGILQALITKPTENFKLTELAQVMKPSSGLGELVGALEALERMKSGRGEEGGGETEEDSIAAMLQAAMQAREQGAPVAPAVVQASKADAARRALGVRVETLAALARAACRVQLPPAAFAALIRETCRGLRCDVTKTLGLVVAAMKRRGVTEREMLYGFQVNQALSVAGVAAKIGATKPAAQETERVEEDPAAEPDDGDDGEEDPEEEAGERDAEEPERFDPR